MTLTLSQEEKKERLVQLFFIDAGGGHRSAMTALKQVLEERNPHWRVESVNLQKILEPVDPVYRLTRVIAPPLQKFLTPFSPDRQVKPICSDALYNAALKKGMTYGFGLFLPIMKEAIKQRAPQLEERLEEYWSESAKPDLVVSLIPNFNGVLYRSLERVYPEVPYVTVMTDLVDTPPRFWMEDQDQHMICGTEKAYLQAVTSGFYDPEKIFHVSGMIMKRGFYASSESNLTKESLGLSPHRKTGLIMFGGNGSLQALSMVAAYNRSKLPVQTIVMCGKNEALLKSLKSQPHCHPVGFVEDVAPYMRLADFFVGKAGPGSLSEALKIGCPVIVEDGASVMPQEKPNLAWVKEKQVGLTVKNFHFGLIRATRKILKDLPLYQENIRKNIEDNRAVFEIAAILEATTEKAETGTRQKRATIRRSEASRKRLSVFQLSSKRICACP